VATEIGPPLTQEFPTSATELVLLTTRPWINGQEILEVRFQLKDHKLFGKIIGKRFPAGALVSAVALAAEAAEAAEAAVRAPTSCSWPMVGAVYTPTLLIALAT
tara:strand:+ start:323 stop:634 length:312 start_codon:yes stop_codon:yes gene_type:complete